MVSDQAGMDKFRRDPQLETAHIPKLGNAIEGEKCADVAFTGLNTVTYTDNPTKTWYSGQGTKGIWAKVINQAIGDNDMVIEPAYTDQDDGTTTYTTPGTVIEDCEDSWDGGGFTTAGDAGVAAVDNKVRGTNAVQLDIDGTSSPDEFIFEQIASADLSEDTYISFWLTTDVTLAAGNFAIGISTATDYASAITEVDVPAQAAATTKNHVVAIAGVAAVQSVGLTMKVDPGDGALSLDDVRMLTATEYTTYMMNRVAGGTVENTVQKMAVEDGDSIKNLLDSTVFVGGKSGDDIELRLH